MSTCFTERRERKASERINSERVFDSFREKIIKQANEEELVNTYLKEQE